MNKEYLQTLDAGTILTIANDDGHKAGSCFKFVRLDKCGHVAIGIIKGVETCISIGRLQGGKHGQ